MSINNVTLLGRLVADTELKSTGTGILVTSFTVAVDRGYVKQGEERQADFIDIVAWRQTAEFVTKYFHKGDMIGIQGAIQTRSYEDKNGNKRKAVEVVAEKVSFCGGKTETKQTAQQAAEVDRIKENISDYPTNDLPGDEDLPF